MRLSRTRSEAVAKALGLHQTLIYTRLIPTRQGTRPETVRAKERLLEKYPAVCVDTVPSEV